MYRNNLKSLYDSGKTIIEIADIIDCTKSDCYRTLKIEGTEFRKVGRRSKCNRKTISDLRKQGLSYREIADQIGLSHVSVFNSLRKMKDVRVP